MKNKPLAFQIWVVISGILLTISIVLIILFSNTLRNFFTNEIYKTIENEQQVLTEYPLSEDGKTKPTPENRSVQHMLVPSDEINRMSQFFPQSFIEKVQTFIKKQKSVTKRYSDEVNGQNIFFVIKKVSVNDTQYILLSYAPDSYRDDLSFTLFKQLLFILGSVILLSWIPSIWLARYLSRPIVAFEKHVKRISQEDWDDPVIVDRQDEIGKLGYTIEDMRQKLIQKDETERTLLQNISHDLKTPVMVIRGYTQSIKDGIFPKGDLETTVEVIEGEAEKLEKKIKDLLYLTKLDYLSKQKRSHDSFLIGNTLMEVVDRIRWSKNELQWNVDLDDEATLEGDPEQWSKLFENVLENQLRYAKSKIDIHMTQESNQIHIVIRNDGPPIEQEMLTSLYEPFSKGKKGEFGIGLSIVKRILSMHQASISIENDELGVRYTIIVPQKRL
ncbi:sensor histidine kinase [Bacillus sp. NPDC077027]|uniref:sensor histidine kinase n=1 Tax=Bacillus sp. NPDC077027 TaxID=3390548 RepID=UPI003D0652C0